ncbi:trypsin-like peptidase domain-containing protein [Streptomyces sp. B93]|uniref:trypsin-like peptidase domain-containing protein n=1 Tax=Streptomyces sp. B93 TaxID=2824875 RepID=UPI001B35BE78|nr:trypsin-like peptidase domain-containing protein [Streptomyces sp. B93]MBQ1091662.1 trypsin-like peptidase domain-containing protein [Streptomyces sp. B93]
MNEGKPTQSAASRPGGTDTGATGAGSGTPGETTDGDFELRRPEEGVVDSSVGSGAHGSPGAAAERTGDAGDGSLPGAWPAPSADAVLADGSALPSGETSSVADAGSGPPTDAPRPLHDPDPYSTPPYGEPGPWAPAPPVQHPGTTPAHGTVTAPVPPQVAEAPVPHPSAHPAPGTAAPMAAPAQGPLVPPRATGPAPAQGPLPAPAPAPLPAQAPAVATPVDAPSPEDPWRRYDPWAVAAGSAGVLQQSGAGVESTRQRRGRVRRSLIGGAVLLALVSGGVGGAVGAYLERNGGVGTVELPQAGKEPSGRAPDSVAGIAARALPGVVTLHVSGDEAQGTGTGFVLDDRGHILTNNHVVEPAGDDGEITVTFHSGDTADAELVGGDSGYDLAVVRVRGVSGLQPMPLGNSDNVQVGDPVVAIGAPFDLAGTVTSGIISAKERPITAGGEKGDGSDISYVDALQTDAPINPGNSGGPLLDSRGHVIGINSAIRSADSGSDLDGGQAGSIGLGFAIPVNQARRVAEELINTGGATHPVIGVTLDMDYSGDGARVGTEGRDGGAPVTPGGPGDRAGIEPGDVITGVDGARIHSGEELIVKIRSHRPGDRLELTLLRAGQERTISLVLGTSDGD